MNVIGMEGRCALPMLLNVDRRLVRRYQDLLLSHLSSVETLAAGIHANPALTASFAATQAAWRFFKNEKIDLPALAQPLLETGRQQIALTCDGYVLVGLDWAKIHYNSHAGKAERFELSRGNDMGYKLLTALAIADRDGSPLAPLCLELTAADGVHSTRSLTPMPGVSPLDVLRSIMDYIRAELGKAAAARPAVFIIDREADSVGHFRDWDQQGHLFLVRADNEPKVLYNLQNMALGDVADALKADDALTWARQVFFKGQPAQQFVAQTSVVLQRPATKNRMDSQEGKIVKKKIAGIPLVLRLIVSEVRDENQRVLARWLMLSNLPDSVDAATAALWYYWRWRIESYHKLLKGAGQQIEQWQQETPEAIARRLAVAAMACVLTWRLARDQTTPAAKLRQVLVQLSGRQMKRGKDQRGFTEPALLAGLGILIPMLILLEEHTLAELRNLTHELLPGILKQPTTRSRDQDV